MAVLHSRVRFGILVLMSLVSVVALSGCAKLKQWKATALHSPTSGEKSWRRETPDGGVSQSTDELVGACKIPVHKDDYAGFSIGQPPSWLVDYSTGTIVVAKDEQELEGAMVFPARVRQDIPAERFAEAFAGALGKRIQRSGGRFELADKVTDGHVARANASATVGGVKLKGPIQVVSERGFVTLKMYWAPDTAFEAEEPTLRQVVTCFQRRTLITAKKPIAPPGGPVTRVGGNGAAKAGAGGTGAAATSSVALTPFHSRYFTGSIPQGWKVKDETANGIDLVSADQGEAVGFGWIQGPIMRPGLGLQEDVNQMFPGARSISFGQAPNVKPGWTSYVEEYETPTMHGYSQRSSSGAVQINSLLMAAIPRWETERPTLKAIAATIQVTPAAVATVNQQIKAQLATLPRATPSSSTSSSSSSSSVMGGWEDREATQDKSNLGFDDAIRGQDRATSPSSGEEYVVPWNAWNATGPQGPGYYRAVPGGDAELLNVSPSGGQ